MHLGEVVVGVSQSIEVGPFVDNQDGDTPETGLSIAQADVRLSKGGAAFAQKNDSGGGTHMENGYYSIPLNATDLNTPGRLRIAIRKTGALPVTHTVKVIPKSAEHAGMIRRGTLQAGSTTGGTLDAGAPATAGLFNGAVIRPVGGTGGTQTSRVIAQYNSDRTFTVDQAWGTALDNTTVYELFDAPAAADGVNITHVEGQLLGSFVGDNLNTFFQNGGGATTKVVDDVGTGGGGGGEADWTTTEKNQIRYRLGLDGTTNTPSASPNMLAELLSAHSGVAGSAAQRLSRLPNVNAGANGGLPLLDSGLRVSANLTAIEGATTIDGVGITAMHKRSMAVLLGKSSKAGNVRTYRSVNDTRNAVQATVVDGDRTAVSFTD